MERGDGEEENQVSTVISFFFSIIPSVLSYFDTPSGCIIGIRSCRLGSCMANRAVHSGVNKKVLNRFTLINSTYIYISANIGSR